MSDKTCFVHRQKERVIRAGLLSHGPGDIRAIVHLVTTIENQIVRRRTHDRRTQIEYGEQKIDRE